MRSHRAREGYLLIDNTFGPGISEEECRRLWPGKIVPTAPEGKKFEAPTITCIHCQQTYFVNPLRTRDRGFCFKCNAYRCDKPECLVCDPFARKLDRAAARIFKAEAVTALGAPHVILP